MARCEICDYCDTIGQSSYNDYSACSNDGMSNRAGISTTWERILAGDGMPEMGVTKIWEQKVWLDERGELCSKCRKEIDLTVWDNYMIYGNTIDKEDESVHNEVQMKHYDTRIKEDIE